MAESNETIYKFFDEMPVYFLYGQALEMLLKAYLRSQGISSKTLEKEYRHDLLKLYNKCREHLLIMEPHTQNMTGILVDHFSAVGWHIQFRYISDFNQQFPTLEAVSVFSRTLLEEVPCLHQQQGGLLQAKYG